MDAMVTARMQAAKKEAGNRVLESLGTNASAAINELYDYVVSQKSLPWENNSVFKPQVSVERIQEALAWVDTLQIEISPEFANMSLKDAKKHRLFSRNSANS